MKVLVVCDQGNNRSVTIASRLRYRDHDCLSAGLSVNAPDTLDLLFKWADAIITTERTQVIPEEYQAKVQLWDVGPDVYPRPFNKNLLARIKEFRLAE